jgi:Enoyl-CoA hydratase/isomerase
MIKEGQYTLLEKQGTVAKITINRPEKRNALSRAAIREMLAVLEELRNDDDIAVVFTTGAGDVAYCAGRDLSEFPTEGGKNRGTDRRAEPRAYHLAEAIRTFPKVTHRHGERLLPRRRHHAPVASRPGHCLGQSTIRFTGDQARLFALPHHCNDVQNFDPDEIRLRDDPHGRKLGRGALPSGGVDQSRGAA